MPPAIRPYLKALLYYRDFGTPSAIAEIAGMPSHDRLTRMLCGSWLGQKLFDLALSVLFMVEKGGFLILDDTLVEKSHSKRLWEASWNWSSKQKKSVCGIGLVLLVWSNGKIRIPIGYRVYRKGGPSKVDLALELLSHARNKLGMNPEAVLFDSWYASARLMKRISDYGWAFVTRLKKNRKFNQTTLKSFQKYPYWTKVGTIAGGLKVLVVKHRKKYFCTNRLSLDQRQVRLLYKNRQEVEEVFRVCKSELGLESCQSGFHRTYKPASHLPPEGPQEHHIVLCLVAFLILEHERSLKGLSFYKLRRNLILSRDSIPIQALTLIQNAA